MFGRLAPFGEGVINYGIHSDSRVDAGYCVVSKISDKLKEGEKRGDITKYIFQEKAKKREEKKIILFGDPSTNPLPVWNRLKIELIGLGPRRIGSILTPPIPSTYRQPGSQTHDNTVQRLHFPGRSRVHLRSARMEIKSIGC